MALPQSSDTCLTFYRTGPTCFQVTRCGALRDEISEFEGRFDRISLDTNASTTLSGFSEAKPILLHGVSTSDFATFLYTVYPSGTYKVIVASEAQVLASGPVTFEAWTVVLKLCKLWDLPSLRLLAVQEIEMHFPQALTHPIDKVVLGKEFGVDKWLKAGCLEICFRDDSLVDDNVSGLDTQTYASLLHMRCLRMSSYIRACKAFLNANDGSPIQQTFDFDEVYHEEFGSQRVMSSDKPAGLLGVEREDMSMSLGNSPQGVHQ